MDERRPDDGVTVDHAPPPGTTHGEPAVDLVHIVRWVATAVASIATLALTRNGLVVSPDSTRYLSAAEGLVGGDGLVTPTGDPLVLFPPGTSFVYAIGEVLPISTSTWVRVVNAACAGAAVWLVCSMLIRHARHRSVVLVAATFATVPVGVLFVTRAAWSEPLYVVAVLAFLSALVRLARQAGTGETAGRPLWICAATVWAACSIRYAGIVLIPVGAVVLFAAHPIGRVRRSAEFIGTASSVPLLLLVLNQVRAGSAFGDRAPGIETLRSVVRLGVEVVGSWVLPLEVVSDAERLRQLLGLAIGVALVVSAGLGLVRTWRFDASHTGRSVVLASGALVALGNLAIVGISQLRTALDPVNLRLVAPALLLYVVAVAMLVDVVIDRAVFRRRAARWFAAAFAIGLVVVQGESARRYIADTRPEPWTYTHPLWTNSEVAAAVRALPTDVVIWTNDPFAIWALTDRRDVDETPRSGAYRSDVVVDFPPASELPDFCRPTVLVWFDNAGSFHHPPGRIEQDVVIYEPIGRADGTLWTVAPPFDCG